MARTTLHLLLGRGHRQTKVDRDRLRSRQFPHRGHIMVEALPSQYAQVRMTARSHRCNHSNRSLYGKARIDNLPIDARLEAVATFFAK